MALFGRANGSKIIRYLHPPHRYTSDGLSLSLWSRNLLDVKEVLLVVVSGQLVIGMLGQVVFAG